MFDLKFDVYLEDEKVGRVELKGMDLIKNESYFDVSKTTSPFMINPFVNMRDGHSVRKFLLGRVVPENRANIGYILKCYGLKKYDGYKLLELTHGANVDDFWWFKFDHLPDDGKSWEDINPRQRS